MKRGFLKWNHDFFKNCRGGKFTVECDENWKIAQKIQKTWAVLEKKMGLSKKFINFSKMARGGNFAVKRIVNSKIRQNLQRFRWYTKIKWVPQKNWIYSEMAKGSNFAVESNWNCQFSQNFRKTWAILQK